MRAGAAGGSGTTALLSPPAGDGRWETRGWRGGGWKAAVAAAAAAFPPGQRRRGARGGAPEEEAVVAAGGEPGTAWGWGSRPGRERGGAAAVPAFSGRGAEPSGPRPVLVLPLARRPRAGGVLPPPRRARCVAAGSPAGRLCVGPGPLTRPGGVSEGRRGEGDPGEEEEERVAGVAGLPRPAPLASPPLSACCRREAKSRAVSRGAWTCSAKRHRAAGELNLECLYLQGLSEQGPGVVRGAVRDASFLLNGKNCRV